MMVSEQVLADALALIKELDKARSTNRLAIEYRAQSEEGCAGGPYDWQRSFHDAGAEHNFRGIIAGNRCGKSRTVGAEVAVHSTGRYPSWWAGHRVSRPVDIIVSGPSNELTRDGPQRELMGLIVDKKAAGTGWIPKSDILNVAFRQSNVTNVMDTAQIKHVSGGTSNISFKSHLMGADKFQTVACDIIWIDEEPTEEQIFTECLMRLLDRAGHLLWSRTPLFGPSAMWRFFTSGKPGTWYVNVGWNRAPHLGKKERAQILEATPDHERATRETGVPLMGSGGVYTIPRSMLECPPFPIPDHFLRITGLDFGIDHPGAGCCIAYDEQADTVYVYDCWKQAGETAAYHSQAINGRGKWIPVAWPHDGMARDKASGKVLADQFRKHGVNMLPCSARYDDDVGGAQAREPVTIDLVERGKTGRFKIFSHLEELFEEMRNLHRATPKGGGPPKIVAARDDIESGLRYGYMMLRYALPRTVMRRRLTRTLTANYDPFDR